MDCFHGLVATQVSLHFAGEHDVQLFYVFTHLEDDSALGNLFLLELLSDLLNVGEMQLPDESEVLDERFVPDLKLILIHFNIAVE